MRKRCTLLALLVILISQFTNHLIAQSYQVQIAAFNDEIDHSFFNYAGYSDVYQTYDHNNFVRYSVGEFYTAEEASRVRLDAIARGFTNTQIITIDQPNYAYAGDSHEIPFMAVPEKEPLYIKSIQFSEDGLSLNKELLISLEETAKIMAKNKAIKLKIVGHTDEIGEPEVNQAISKKRARSIQNFLLANGIPAYRINMKVSENPTPEVYFKGKGLPKTRDFNRRIILSLVDLKEEIIVNNFQKEIDLKNIKSLSSVEKVADILKFIRLV